MCIRDSGEVVPDLSANPELGDYDNYLFGDYTTADGKYTVRINEAVDQFVLSEKGVGDEYTPIYDETYTAAADAEYGAYDVTEPDPEDPEGVYERVYKDYALNEITTDAGTVQVVFRDFYTHILDRADSLEINLYAVCDVTIGGTTFRLYNNTLYGRQDCYNVSSQGERRDHYTIIQYEQFVTYSYEGVETTVTEYPAYVEYTNGDTYMFRITNWKRTKRSPTAIRRYGWTATATARCISTGKSSGRALIRCLPVRWWPMCSSLKTRIITCTSTY